MPTIARFQATAIDDEGNVVPLASIEVRQEIVGSPLASLFSDRSGASPIGNPFTADADGYFAFHVAGGAYKITASLGGFSRTWRYVGIGTASELDVEDILDISAQPLSGELTAIAALSGTGFATRVGDDDWETREILAGAAASVTNGKGIAGDVTVNVILTQAPGGRLSLTTAVAVQTAEQTAATTIYYVPYRGLFAPLYDGTSTLMKNYGGELSLALDSNSGHTGYHQSGKNFDLFLYLDSTTYRLVSGPAWTSNTARNTSLELKNGFWTNGASMTGRFGSASGNTVTVAQNRGLYLGTFRASADGQTAWTPAPSAAAGGSDNKLFLWNAYHRVDVIALERDNTNSWNYTTATWRQANASTGNKIAAVFGLNEESVLAYYAAAGLNSSSVMFAAGVGLDVTNAFTGLPGGLSLTTFAQIASGGGGYVGLPGIGYHEFNAVEYSTATGTTTWYGDNNAPTVTQTGLVLRARM